MLTTEVENFPGFPMGIQGPELMRSMRTQAERFQAAFFVGRVTRVDFSGQPLRMWVGDQEFMSRSVIISTGARALMLGLAAESRLLGRGVSTCATCDGFFFRGRQIAVVGGGDSALEEANFLSRFASRVTVIHRRDSLRASKIMQDRARANPKISFAWNTQVVDILGEKAVSGLRLRDTQTTEERTMAVSGVFVAIGHRPNTDLFRGQVDLDAEGYIKTGPGMATNVAGVFACGDVQDRTYRQAITSAGSGCMAAMDAERWLEALDAAQTREASRGAKAIKA